ncbi:MAG: single-stranded DNA-binding protein [Peptoniphilus sp.]|nr:single-stranded DNA-binding protein [Peptoniphilus sp.]MDY3118758.1 single-stranded DNA-binding protein [Peptoniphilus sp.]
MNLVVLYGRLTRDPELRYSQNGVANTFATVAVDRGMSREKRQEAEASGQPTADFIGIKAFGKTAELLGNYFHKGDRIALEGRISTGSYEKNGERVYTTDVVVNRVHFVESAKESGNMAGGGNMAPPTNMAYRSNNQNQPGNSFSSGFGPKSDDEGYYPIDNNDIPF